MRYKDLPEIRKIYNSARWIKTRKAKLSINPICERCKEKGIITPAVIIHHKEYITDKNYTDENIVYNLDNLESLCHQCHNEEHFTINEYRFDENGNILKEYEKKKNIY